MLRMGEKCACKLLDDLHITQPTLSHHMKLLCDADIVQGRKEGKWVHYSINSDGAERSKKILGCFHGIGANIIAVVGGTIIEKIHMENYVEEFIRNASSVDIESDTLTVKDRLVFAKEQVVETFKKVFHIFWLVSVSAQSFTTGFRKAGFKLFLAATICLA